MKRNSEQLSEIVERTVEAAKSPYSANRYAIEAIDIDEDVDAGIDELRLMMRGLDKTVAKLKELKRAADIIARSAASVISGP